ncbi:extracellular solute-binding protein [Niameybacter massiliensis]|uniref:Extracellular solute-binding protein n=1 Tax=Holtiella tumoricola TaxID=3018743 RepID=A0AA42DLY8_9FIRM|nr:extracellular solute-binding protein [Holtiella tumoricola]MDA3731303.1 extracellular solute-binding protein [Holtiella tumoricola]
MTKFTRVLTLATASMLVLSSVAGCSKPATDNGSTGTPSTSVEADQTINLEGYPIVPERIDLTAFAYGEPGQGSWDDYPVFKELAEKTNVFVDFETVSGDGATEKLNLVLASNKLPDMFFSGLSSSMINKYAGMGLFMPLNDLIDQYAPNISALLAERPDIKKAITMPDGNIYSIPAVNATAGQATTQLCINKTWLDKLGLEVPTTTDEFYEVLKAFKTQDPNGNGKADEIGMSYEPVPPYDVWNGDTGFSGAFGVVTLTGSMMLNNDQSELIYTPVQEGYKEYIKWTSTLYTEGLLDTELFTQDHNQYMAKVSSDYLGAYLTNGPIAGGACEFIAIEPLAGPDGTKLWSQFDYSIDKNRAIISATCSNPAAAMRYIDSFFEKEHSLKLRYGNRLEARGDQWEIMPSEPGAQSECPSAYVPTLETVEIKTQDLIQTPDGIAADERQAMYAPYLAPYVPNMNLTPEESKELSALQTDLQDFVNLNKAKWTTGQNNIDAEWDKYVAQLNQMGLTRYMEIYNGAYQRYLGN